jgi:hypothetical protein
MELVRDEQPPPAEAMAAAADDGTKQQEPSRVVCFGELLVDFVPTVGGLPVFDEPGFKAGAGGAPANVAVGICKLGIPAAFIGKLGDDEFGYALANVLKEHGVETRGVRFDSHAHTGLAFISLRSDGERTFIFYRNPSADMLMVSTNKDLAVHIHLSQRPQQRCSVCDPGKMFLISKFSYLLFSNSTGKTKTGTGNKWKTINSKPSGPIREWQSYHIHYTLLQKASLRKLCQNACPKSILLSQTSIFDFS